MCPCAEEYFREPVDRQGMTHYRTRPRFLSQWVCLSLSLAVKLLHRES